MLELLRQPWPWWVVGPLVGLVPAALLWIDNRMFGVSSNLRHACAVVTQGRLPFLAYDWWKDGGWNLAFAAGIVAGGFLAGGLLANPEPVALAARTRADLEALGIREFTGLVPAQLFDLTRLFQPPALFAMVAGGFLVGFGTAWAGGCTSGHGLTGIADLQLPSLIALLSFFAGGLIGTHLLLPRVLAGLGG